MSKPLPVFWSIKVEFFHVPVDSFSRAVGRGDANDFLEFLPAFHPISSQVETQSLLELFLKDGVPAFEDHLQVFIGFDDVLAAEGFVLDLLENPFSFFLQGELPFLEFVCVS